MDSNFQFRARWEYGLGRRRGPRHDPTPPALARHRANELGFRAESAQLSD
jgi:hypothetical protein